MTGWSYPGPQGRGQQGKLQCTEPRWGKPAWKSLAWATQLLAALDFFFICMAHWQIIGDAAWWCAVGVTGVLVVLVSVLAVR